MSYYGYPNAQAYSANYAQYAAAYAAQTGTYDQYQAAAAYNAAAYTAMQQHQQQQSQQPPVPPPPKQPPPPGISISATPQRYEYQTGTAYDANTYPPPASTVNQTNTNINHHGHPNQQFSRGGHSGRGGVHGGPKWGQLPGQPGSAKFNKPGYGQSGFGAGTGGRGGAHQGFMKRNQSGSGSGGNSGGNVQVFYCEVCKISCAGPQTYKEHLDGQKHKKRENTHKLNEAAQVSSVSSQPSDQSPSNLSENSNQSLRSNQNSNNLNNRHLGSSTGNINRTTTSSNLVIQCALCDIACTGKDAYAAHVRGAKHQKTIKLHQKLGKPIPPDNPVYTNVVKSPNMLVSGGLINSSVQPQVQDGVISASPQIVGQAQPDNESCLINNLTVVNTLESDANGQRTDSLGLEEDLMNIEPVGKEYIETKQDGKVLSFYCKLCDCQFNDPNAKDMHTKGRRHRLAYKRKVDPSLRVDMKGHDNNKMIKQQRNRSADEGQNQRHQQTGGAPMRLMEMTGINKPGGGGGSVKPLMAGNEGQGIQKLMATQFNQYGQSGGGNNGSGYPNRHETFDDKHIIAKHNLIYPSQEEISAIQEIVSCTEKALKLVSDQIADEDSKSFIKQPVSSPSPTTTTSPVSDSSSSIKKPDECVQVYRALKGVMRVGLLAKGLLLKGDTDVQLIVLCAQKPTKSLLARVYKILLEKIDVVSPEIKYSIIHDQVAETIVLVKTTISDLQPLITCKIMLTSPLVRTDLEEADAAANSEGSQGSDKEKEVGVQVANSADLLDKQRCLDSLAPLRHAKWFQARAANLQNCVVIIRILRDLCQRNPTWAPLSQWGLELLVEKCLSSSTSSLSLGESLRRVLESVSSGILLPDGPGLYDPCEKEPTDVLANCLSNQQREELTSSAQMALRLLAFKQVYKILGMECLLYQNNNLNRMPKKRPMALRPCADQSAGTDLCVDEKRVRKEDEDEEACNEDVD